MDRSSLPATADAVAAGHATSGMPVASIAAAGQEASGAKGRMVGAEADQTRVKSASAASAFAQSSQESALSCA